jgi:hypothetical protein
MAIVSRTWPCVVPCAVGQMSIYGKGSMTSASCSCANARQAGDGKGGYTPRRGSRRWGVSQRVGGGVDQLMREPLEHILNRGHVVLIQSQHTGTPEPDGFGELAQQRVDTPNELSHRKGCRTKHVVVSMPQTRRDMSLAPIVATATR